MLLICQCGQKLNTPGATPGRVGRCPRCGSMLRINAPELVEAPAAEAPPDPARPTATTYHRPPRAHRGASNHRQVWADGWVAHPLVAEWSFRDSLRYPFRNASGIALLGFLPPLLWFGATPLLILIPLLASGSVVTWLALILQLPLLILFFFVLGHLCQFLGAVVVTSCLGEVALPRPASWVPGEVAAAGLLWVWAVVAGGFMGGWPPLLYWLRCGDVDWFDQIILIELILPGIAYAQMALVLALTDNSPWAAGNPVRVLGAIGRGGWGYFWPCLITGSFLALACWGFKACLETGNVFAAAVAFWLWWVLALYLAMVALRRLGLFCYRSRAVAVAPRRQRG